MKANKCPQMVSPESASLLAEDDQFESGTDLKM